MKKLLGILLFAAGFSVLCRAQTIPDEIDTILARSTVAANTWTIQVQNETGSTTYYQKNPTTGKAPASNVKIFTTSGAFGLLGTNYSFASRVYLAGSYTNGVLTGNLNLVTEHDITWNESVFGTGNARMGLDHIVTKLKALGLSQVVGNVQVYGACMYNHASTDDTRDYLNQDVYNLEGATALVAALQAQGITVSGSAVGVIGFNPPGTLFYTHKSSDLTYGGKPLELDIACIPLAKESHNVMADLLLRHIGYHFSTNDTFTAGRNKVFGWLQSTAGISTNGMVMDDGSGLSHNDRFTAQEVVTLTRFMLNTFPSWKTILPIGCVDGTLGGRFCSTDGSGQVHAKTGSLSISIALSGYIDNKYDNRRYFFSFISNNSSGIDDVNTRQAIDDCVVLFGARGVPTGPQIISVVNTRTNALTVTWGDDKFVRTGYKIYPSTNGINFDTPISLGSAVQSYTEKNLPTGTKKYYRVTVVSSGGESPASRVYGAMATTNVSKVLIVDGDDRWQFQTTENPNADNHNFCAIAGQNISGPAFDMVNHNAVIAGTLLLTNYPAVVWLLGEESTVDESFSSAEQGLVTTYLTNNGDLFLSGSEVGWDLDRSSGPTTADRNFYHNQLRAALANDDAATYAFTPVANSIFSGDVTSGFDNGTHGTYNVDFPDVLTPTNGSVAALSYSGGIGGTAAVIFDGSAQGNGKLVNFGFPFETITNAAARDAYMSDVLKFFGVLDTPRMFSPVVNAGSTQVILTWSASAGLKYRVQFKADLNQGTWTDVVPDITATGTTAGVTNAVSGSQRFYRIVMVN